MKQSFPQSSAMNPLALHLFHESRGGRFGELAGSEIVCDYGAVPDEYVALRQTAAVLDLSFRGRLCLTGADRMRFLHGQVTNDVQGLLPGDTTYAALVTAKGKMVSDLNIICLRDELLIDLEPGTSGAVQQRLEQFIIADDVQVVDVAPHYGLVSVQGPKAGVVVAGAGLGLATLPALALGKAVQFVDAAFGEVCCVHHRRGAADGFDLYVPGAGVEAMTERLVEEAKKVDGRLAGWEALEIGRVEAGLPRFGQDMDPTNLAPETGIDARAISYAKGCYIGQEVIARIRTYGQVTKALRGLELVDDISALPSRGDKLFHGDREVGYITSAIWSPALQRHIALGYVRKEHNAIGEELSVDVHGTRTPAKIVTLPFIGVG